MPKGKTDTKRFEKQEKRRVRNRSVRATVKTFVSRAREAVGGDEVGEGEAADRVEELGGGKGGEGKELGDGVGGLAAGDGVFGLDEEADLAGDHTQDALRALAVLEEGVQGGEGAAAAAGGERI